MRLQRITGLALLAAAAGTFAMTSRTAGLPVIVCVLALAGLPGRVGIKLPVRPFLAGMLLAVVFFVIGRISPFEDPRVRAFLFYPVAYSIGQFLLVWMMLQFFIRKGANTPLPSMMPLYAAGVCVCAGDVLLISLEQDRYEMLALGVAALSILFFIASRQQVSRRQPKRAPGRLAIMATVVAVSLAASWISIGQMQEYENEINRFFDKIVQLRRQVTDIGFENVGSVDFSQGAELKGVNAIKLSANPDVMLRVFSSDEPGYMRAAVYDTLSRDSGSKWKSSAKSAATAPARNSLTTDPRFAGDGELFMLGKMGTGKMGTPCNFPSKGHPKTSSSSEEIVRCPHFSADCRRMDVWPAPTLSGAIFAPAETLAIRARVSELTVSEHQALSASMMPAGFNYQPFVVRQPSRLSGKMGTPCNFPGMGHPETSSSSAEVFSTKRCPHFSAPDGDAITEELKAKCLAIPAGLDARVADLAKEIFAGCVDDASRVSAVRRYFADNYQYSLNLTVPPGEDPLTYFLLNKPSAHCEFFASGAAVLLRLGNVPTRYVTGFVASHRNEFGGYWLATSNDAHAWVEAWVTGPDGAGQWVTVEATPAGGVPDSSPQGSAGGLWDAVRFNLLQLRIAIDTDGLKGLGLWVWRQLVNLGTWLATSAPGIVILALLAFVAGRRWLKRRPLRRRGKPVPAEVAQLRRLLAEMDRRARRLGMSRRPAETLNDFAARVRSQARHDSAPALAGWYEDYAAARYGGEASADDLRQRMSEPRRR